jgi:hypothetical protein
VRQTDVVNKLLEKMEQKLTGENSEMKVTLADYIRLIQLKKEIEDEEPKEIRVTWVDRESESSSEN